METIPISFRKTGYFSKIICDYIENKPELRSFYNYEPELASFKQAIEAKSKENIPRTLLVEVLKEQYKHIDYAPLVQRNIELLSDKNTFTVTTGHQLNIFTGPLYFIYKIITTIKLARKVAEQYPEYQIIPVYWMATEDHDFAEINHVNLFNKQVVWDVKTKGAVGNIPTSSFHHVLSEMKAILGESEYAKELIHIFENAYSENALLSEATRTLVHTLFQEYGLVIIDGNDPKLKQQIIPFIKNDLTEQNSFRIISETNKRLTPHYDLQVNPRELNFFYLTDEYRERLIVENNTYKTIDNRFVFTKQELEEEIKKFPERFSPNVVTRPLYEEMVLPNLAYVGGPGEIAYWLQLKDLFHFYKVNFPILILRNSFLFIDENTISKMKKLTIHPESIFNSIETWTQDFITRNAKKEISLQKELVQIEHIFETILRKAFEQDNTLQGTVEAEKKKTIHSLQALEQKLVKAEKKKFEIELNQLQKIKTRLFPENELQERHETFSSFYVKEGKAFISKVMDTTDPFGKDFIISL